MKERGETLLKLLGFFFSPTVFESDSLVEYKIFGSGVGVDTEITDALELIFVTNSGIFGKEWLDECSGNFQRIGYFCVDPDSTADNLVFNKTIGLKDSWAKEKAK